MAKYLYIYIINHFFYIDIFIKQLNNFFIISIIFSNYISYFS